MVKEVSMTRVLQVLPKPTISRPPVLYHIRASDRVADLSTNDYDDYKDDDDDYDDNDYDDNDYVNK